MDFNSLYEIIGLNFSAINILKKNCPILLSINYFFQSYPYPI